MSKRDVWEFTNTDEDVWMLVDYLEKKANSVNFTFEDDSEMDAFFLKCRNEFQFFAERCLVIRGKDNTIAPIRLNKAQQYMNAIAAWQMHHTGKVRIVVVKGRQQGMSTTVQARAYWKTIHTEAYHSLIMAHQAKSSSALFDMTKRYHQHCPEDLQPVKGHDNGMMLSFPELDSKYAVATAGSTSAGRGLTASFFHGSEVGFFDDGAEIASGIMQAIPNADGTEVYLESTANGASGYFYTQWMLAAPAVNDSLTDADSSGFIRVFVPWFWQDEYRSPAPDSFVYSDEESKYARLYGLDRDQMFWRRKQIKLLDGDSRRFDRDYPATAELAFQATGDNLLITGDMVASALYWSKSGKLDPVGATVMGVDVAAMGDDSTAFVIRRGRVVLHCEKLSKATNGEIANRLHVLRETYGVNHTFIDGTGGYGTGVHDLLAARGAAVNVTMVHFAEKATEDHKYANKRAEMWVRIRDWMRNAASLPQGHDWGRDLCAPTYRFDGDRLRLEKKDEIKKRIGRSPDIGDALALTFAFPVIEGGYNDSYEPEYA